MREPLAYDMMFRFLEERYLRQRSDDLGALLGELSLAADGKPRDEAVVEEWNRAVESVSVERETKFAGMQAHRRAG